MDKLEQILGDCPKEIVKKSQILNSPLFITSYQNYGLEGLKAFILQELIKLELYEIENEIGILSLVANYSKDIKRTLRATKLLASQWLEDKRRDDITKQKAQTIFELIPTFYIGKVITQEQAEESSIIEEYIENTSPTLNFTYSDSDYSVNSENRYPLNKGDIILFLIEIQGNYEFLEDTLETYGFISKEDNNIVWVAPPNFKLVIIGNLFNTSPYSVWQEKVHFDSFKVIALLRHLMNQAPENIFLSYGDYDLEIASKSIFLNPLCNFTSNLGVYTQAQSLPIIISILKSTALTGSNSYCIWERHIEEGIPCFSLKDQYKVNNKPNIILPALSLNEPDISPLIDFLEKLYSFAAPDDKTKMPKSWGEIDKFALQNLPQSQSNLNISDLVNSNNRAYFLEGLLKGLGFLDFLQKSVGTLNVFETEDKAIFFAHITLNEQTIEMVQALKSNNWQFMNEEEFIKSSKFLKTKNISLEKLVKVMQDSGFNSLNEFLTYSPEQVYNMLLERKKLELFIPMITPRKDKQGFIDGLKKWKENLLTEDKTGMIGFRINSTSNSRKLPKLMSKIGKFDDKAFLAYTDKFINDLFLEENLSKDIEKLSDNRMLIFIPDDKKPEFKIGLEILPDIGIYMDDKNIIHIPIKHLAFIEYLGG